MEDLLETRRPRERQDWLERKMLQAQRLERLGALAGSIAHDIDNLFVAIPGNAEPVAPKFSPGPGERNHVENRGPREGGG